MEYAVLGNAANNTYTDCASAEQPARTFEGIAFAADRTRGIRREIDRTLNRIEAGPQSVGEGANKEGAPLGYNANLARLHSEIDRLEKAVSLLTSHV